MPRGTSVVRISSKGQIVIPASVRRQLGLKGAPDRGGPGRGGARGPAAPSARERQEPVGVGVMDAGVAVGWLHRRHRSFSRIERLFAACRGGEIRLVMSIVNLAEVLTHTAELSRTTGVDPVALLSACGVQFHSPDEAVARRGARPRTSLAA